MNRLRRITRQPERVVKHALPYSYRKLLGYSLAVNSRIGIGTNVLKKNWDVLVILDTCRVDALKTHAPCYLDVSPDSIKSYLSVGSQTAEWLSNTFTTDRPNLNQIAYASGNAWASQVLVEGKGPESDQYFDNVKPPNIEWSVASARDLGRFIPLWGNEEETTLAAGSHSVPAKITDATIKLHRDEKFNRVIAHYIQPHPPYESKSREEGRDLTDFEYTPMDYLRNGGNKNKPWKAYISDLKWVLKDVKELTENIDGKVAITSDHGEAFGEYKFYGHAPGMLHPQVRRVPWLEIECSDHETRYGEIREQQSADVGHQLEALGYR